MKNLITTVIILLVSQLSIAQNIDYNLDGGYIAEGYDVVSYFDNKPVKGKKNLTYIYEGVKLKFASEGNLQLFKSDPTKYFPAYGGWCAYAMGTDGSKVAINPKTFEIREGRLYLFYNAWGTNTLKKWLSEDPRSLKEKADTNWEKS